MTLLHTMSLAGSIAVVIYMVLYPFTKRYFPMLWHKIYLTIATLLFITPFQYIGTNYRTWIGNFLRREILHREQQSLIEISERTIFIYDNAVYFSNPKVYIILFLCLLLSIWLLVGMMRRYQNLRYGIMEGTWRDESAESLLQAYSETLRMNTNATVYRGKYLETPVTVGILHQKIILPDMEWSEEALKSVFRHELAHIRVKDNLVKLIVLLAVILNFYNPLVYYLRYKWNLIAEMYCDDVVIKGKNGQEMTDYANVIISLAEERENDNTLPIVGLNSAKRALKERIERIEMMKRTGKKYGKISAVLGSVVTLAMVFASSLTVLAYEPKEVDFNDKDTEYVGEEVELFYVQEEIVCLDLFGDSQLKKYEEYITEDSDNIFIDEAGNVYYGIDEVNEGTEPYMICIHSYSSGTLIKHSKYPDGSCKVDNYSGQMCEKCGHVVYGDHISTTTYDVCPH